MLPWFPPAGPCPVGSNPFLTKSVLAHTLPSAFRVHCHLHAEDIPWPDVPFPEPQAPVFYLSDKHTGWGSHVICVQFYSNELYHSLTLAK